METKNSDAISLNVSKSTQRILQLSFESEFSVDELQTMKNRLNDSLNSMYLVKVRIFMT